MTRIEMRSKLPRKALSSVLAALTLLACVEPAWAILGVWRRAAVRTAVVAGAVETSAAASQEAAATASAQSAAQASEAAARQSAAAANQAAAAATAAATKKTPQQKLAELQSLYNQKLISKSDYDAAKAKIVNSLTQ